MNNHYRQLQIDTRNLGSFDGSWFGTGTADLLNPSPVDGLNIGAVVVTTPADYDRVVKTAQETFECWRCVPAPKRGDVIREIGNAFRAKKQDLAELIAHENGKILAEANGEVQELIDIADFAVGLSRQLYGNSMHSERPFHRMYEQWHPLGVVGVITAFNFPLAVWGWNAMIAAVCGNSVVWKPSELTPLTAIAAMKICEPILRIAGFPGLFSLVSGTGKELGERLCSDTRVPLISATGSCAMGRRVGQVVAERFGRSLLELGGNNAITVLKDADLELASRAIFFGAVGTAGQRCTTTRRVLVERDILDSLTLKLKKLYQQVTIGDPRLSGTLMGPLISANAVRSFHDALKRATAEGGSVIFGGKSVAGMPTNNYVEPTLVLASRSMPITFEETFAPITYLIPIDNLNNAIEANNEVPQGLSSAIFTQNVRAAERFLSQAGSDCGIANVNIGTSGAEIGGAFGGEKETGGGREAGSDSWKAYMRRQTCTINWGTELPLAQGIVFGE